MIHRTTHIVTSLLISSLYFLIPLTAVAQRPPGVTSLGEMSCQTVRGRGSYHVTNEDSVIGLEVFRISAALFGGGFGNFGSMPIDWEEPLTVACRLANPNEVPRYTTLTLAFGIPDENRAASDGEVTRLSVYLDGEFYQYIDVVKGEQFLWSIEVSGVRSIALEGRCLRDNNCGGIYFIEDILE